jgi:serine/threonine protein kinase
MAREMPQNSEQGARSEDKDKMIGVVLDGRYEIVELIGEGGMGSIYKAKDQRLAGRPVAVKIIHPHLQLTDLFVERFKVEQQALAKVRSPHIVAIQDVGEYQYRPYFVMEYIEGQGLDTLLKREGSLPMSQAVGIAEQVAKALDAAHQEGIIHRDVKPSNILIGGPSDSPIVKLTDFGVARLEDAPHLTTGGVVGTALYMSPDQIDPDGKVDLRSDVYSLGAVLYHMLTGRPPFDYDTQWKVAQAHLAKEPPSLHRLNRNVAKPVENVVLKALSKKKERRYASAGELARALKEATVAKPRQLSWLWVPTTALLGLLFLLGIALGKSVIATYGSAGGIVLTPAPTPTAAVAAVPGPAATPTEMAAPPVSKSPTETPTPLPPPRFVISSFVFATSVDSAGQPLGQGTAFRPEDGEVYAFFDYSGMADGLPIHWAWYLNDRQIEERQARWAKGESGTAYLKIGKRAGVLAPGSYRLDLWVNDGLAPVAGKPLRSGAFTVEAKAAPAAIPTPALARMLYTIWVNQDYQIYTANTDGSDSWFAAGPGDSPSWSPDGQQIAFNGRGGMADGVGLYIMRIGGEPQRYVSQEVRHTRWSPDGTRIAYDSLRTGFVLSKLFLCLLDKEPYECELPGLPGEMPAWNPQGNMLVYRDCDEEGNCSLSIVDVDRAGAMTGQRRIPNTGNDFSPDWSPDGNFIVYSRKVSESDFNIYTIRPDGSDLKRLTGTPYLEVTPSWTPDGRQILFRSNRGDSWGIYIMNADGTNQRKIIDAPTGPDWGIASTSVTRLP